MLAILYFLYLIYFLYFPSISFCSRASRHRRGASRDARCACRIFSRWAAAARRARLRDRAARRRVRPRRAAQAAIASVRAECPRADRAADTLPQSGAAAPRREFFLAWRRASARHRATRTLLRAERMPP